LITQKDFYEVVRDNWQVVRGAISDWFHDLKEFEKDDTFAAALKDGRMTMRWAEMSLVYPSMRSWEGQEYTKKTRTVWDPVNRDPNTNLPKRVPITVTARVKDEIKEYKDMPLDVSMKGLLLRMSPDAFTGGSANATKYTSGLHDLSANLLKGGRALSTQTFNKIADGDLYAFMPLSVP
jgi:hypothetical protein